MKDLCLIQLPNLALESPTMYQPLGVLYLAAMVHQHGGDVCIADMREGEVDLPQARFYGFSCTTPEINKAIESVKEFSELEDYFDMPIKTYSSGMKSRLSFGLSLAFDFDYLIIDETLSVGDTNFQVKAKAALRKKIESCNVLLVSHSMPVLKEICDAGIVVNDGKLEYFEDINSAIEVYENLNKQRV